MRDGPRRLLIEFVLWRKRAAEITASAQTQTLSTFGHNAVAPLPMSLAGTRWARRPLRICDGHRRRTHGRSSRIDLLETVAMIWK